jgi:hypothetical protein
MPFFSKRKLIFTSFSCLSFENINLKFTNLKDFHFKNCMHMIKIQSYLYSKEQNLHGHDKNSKLKYQIWLSKNKSVNDTSESLTLK